MLKVMLIYNYFFIITFIIRNENGIAIKLAAKPASFSFIFINSTNTDNPAVCIINVGIPDNGNLIYLLNVGLTLKL